MIGFIVAAGITLQYMLTDRQTRSDYQEVIPNNFVPEGIIVTFKDAVTFQQALALISSYNLTFLNPDADNEEGFIPKSYRAIKVEQFELVKSNLKNYTEVASFNDVTSDPINNRAGKDEKWVEVVWKQDVTFEQIKAIQAATGLGLSDQPHATDRTVFLKVPAGQESGLVNIFESISIVRSADRMQDASDIQ